MVGVKQGIRQVHEELELYMSALHKDDYPRMRVGQMPFYASVGATCVLFAGFLVRFLYSADKKN